MLEIVKLIASLFNIVFGVYALLMPEAVAKASHFVADTARGRTELRVTMAGYFIGMGVGAVLMGSLLQQQNAAYQTVGFAWLGGAVVRLLSLALEDSREMVDSNFWVLLGIEFIIGIVLLIPT